MKPDIKVILLLLLSITCHPMLNGLEIKGQTISGMKFHGEVTSLRAEILHIVSSNDKGGTPVGIPLQAIQSVQVNIPEPPDPEIGLSLESLVPILPYCDKSTLSGILKWIRSMEKAGKWPSVYLWASRILATTKEPAIQLEAGLAEAQALLEMGLYKRLESRLESLNALIEPLKASPLLCELNARFCGWEGDSERARFWMELPGLQIPAKPNKDR